MGNKETTRKAIYDKENTRRIHVKLNNKTDADILAALEAQSSHTAYIKRLIRADIAAQQQKASNT